MKYLLPIIAVLAVLFSLLLSVPSLAQAQSASPWFITGGSSGYIRPVNGTLGLRVPGLTSTTSPGCLQVLANGWIQSTASSCGGTGSAWPFTPSTYNGVANQSTTTPLWLKDTMVIASTTFFTRASSTDQTVLGSLWIPNITSALGLFGSDGLLAEYAGATCTNQFVRVLSAAGVATCATVSLTADVTGTLAYSNGGTGTSTPATWGNVLYWNGSTWQGIATSSLSITSVAAGSNKQVQFNNSGSLGANFGFIWDTSTKQLDIGDGVATTSISGGSVTSGSATNLFVTAGNDLSLTASDGTAITLGGAEIYNFATTTTFDTDVFTVKYLTSALTVTGAGGTFEEYAGAGCTNQVVEDIDARGASTCVSINNGYWSGTDLSVANGGTGLSTFGGANHVLYTTSPDTLSSEAAFTYDSSTNLLKADKASSTLLSVFGTAYFGGTATTTINSLGKIDATAASSTHFSALTSFYSPVTSAVLLADSNKLVGAASTQTCTNQFVRAMSGAYVATCATVGAADVSLANLTATDSTLTFSGTYNGSTARTIGLNLGNANNWTALQTFVQASSTRLSVHGTAYFGGTATTTINSAGKIDATAASSTHLSALTSFYSPVTSAVLLADANKLVGAASAQTCTNQFVRALSAAYVATCATVQSEDINLADDFVWTGVHDFGGASSLEIKNGSNDTVDAIGEITLDTTVNDLVIATSTNAASPGIIPTSFFSSFNYSTSTSWTGTTTIALGPAPRNEKWLRAWCATDASFVAVRFGDNTNWMNYNIASTTVGTSTLNANNSFIQGEKRYVAIGTTTTATTREISCTVEKIYDRQ